MRDTAQRLGQLVGRLALALASVGLASTALAQEEPKVLNIYNWSDYIGENTIANFEKEFGIKVRYDNFDNNEILHAKLVAGRSGYDIVVPSSNWAKMQIEAGLFRKLDKSRLSNLKNMDPALQKQLAAVDPDNAHLVTWMWGYTTIGINKGRLKEALGDLPMPENAWDLLFDPKYVSRAKACGVSVLDSATDVVPAALHYVGKPAYSRNAADYQAASDMLRTVRPHITLFSSSGYINDMAQGRICVALGWSGDMAIAKNRALEAKNGHEIEVLIPSTGGMLFFDTMAIPADARHPNNAHLFIDYIMRPEVHAELSNEVFYANPNLASRPFVEPEVANDPTVFLGPEDMARMVPPDSLSNDLRRLSTRTYTNFKTGR